MSYRTFVCCKETHEGAKIDPSPEWTGTWQDPVLAAVRRRAAGDRAQRDDLRRQRRRSHIQVPAADAQMRFWRNTPKVVRQSAGSTRTCRTRRSATSGTRTSTTASGPPASCGSRRPSSTSPDGSWTTARHSAREPQPTTWSSTSAQPARSSPARARSSGRGGSTPTTIAATTRRASTCSRRR